MRQLSFHDARIMLNKYRMRIAESEVADTKTHAVEIAKRVGFPVVMKIASSDVIHKTDAGCVRVGVTSSIGVEHFFDEIKKNAKKAVRNAKIEGVIVQEMVTGHEIIIGGKRDPQFGPVVLFGLGGVFVEILKDVSLRVAPVTKSEAMRMIKEIKGYPLLAGARGKKPVDFDKIAQNIAKVSSLMMEEERVVEMDLNPLFVNEKDCVVADVRVMVKE